MSQYGAITLTNYRVVLDYEQLGSSRHASITLDAISSCEVATASQPLLLVIGILFVPAAVVAFLKDVPLSVCGGLLVGAVVLIATYLATRNRTLTITSHGGTTLALLVDHVPRAIAFLDQVEEVKLVALGRVRRAEIAADVSTRRRQDSRDVDDDLPPPPAARITKS